MAAIPAAAAWLGAGLGLSHVAPGYFGGDDKNKNNNNQNNQYQGQPVYHIQSGNQGFGISSMVTAACVGGGVVLFFGAYKYFFGTNPLDKLIPEIQEQSAITLDQVRKADENAQARNEKMDENNRQRLIQLRAELQGENRGNFEVLSEQINCLTQIALQTLTSVTPGEAQLAITPGGPTDQQALTEMKDQRKQIMDYAKKAQGVADEIADPRYHEKKRSS
eukprot:UN31380